VQTEDAIAIGAVAVFIGWWLITTILPQSSIGGQFALVGKGIGSAAQGAANFSNETGLTFGSPPVSD
jgi:hypothetical protein